MKKSWENSMWVAEAKAIAKRCLPGSILNHMRACRALERRDRSTYWRLRLLRALRMRPSELGRTPAAIRSILFVCRGNIIRSPMAAALLRQSVSVLTPSDISIASAGLHACPGQGADARAITVAKDFGVSLDEHRAQPLTDELVQRADMILVMDTLNEAELLGRYPEAESKVFMLGAWAAGRQPDRIEILDPYDGGEADIRQCYERLQSHIRSLSLAPALK
jgi:protein-tyrosine-phosphatase